MREQQRELSGNQFRKRLQGASTCTACACASGRTSSRSCARPAKAAGVHAQPRRRPSPTRSTARCWPACCRTSALRDAAPRASTSARAARASRSSPARRSSRRQPDVGHGRRARRDVAAVGAHAARASTRRGSSRSPSTSSAARTASRAGTASAARGRRDRARDAVRAADRRRPRRSPTGAIDPAPSRELFIRRALVERDWDDAPRVLRRQRRRRSRRSRRSRTARAAATSSSPTRSLYDFFDARVPESVVSGRALRPLVARRAPRATRTCSRTRASCSSTPRPRTGSRGAAGRRPGARATLELRADLPLRAGRAATTA